MKKPSLFLLTVAFILYSCSVKDKESFEVTYQVDTPHNIPLKVFIRYSDLTGIQTFVTKEKHWAKKVKLRHDCMAELVITASYDSDEPSGLYPAADIDLNDTFGNKHNQLINGKIVHTQKTVEEFAENLILISLFKSECHK